MIACASALVLMTAVASADDGRIHLGLDATDFSPSFLLTAPEIDPGLLVYAPTSPDVAFAASAISVGTGFFLAGAGAALLIAGPRSPKVPGFALLAAGVLMMDFGACMGDLLNGDVRRFVVSGLLRIAGSIVFAILGPVGLLGWAAWVAMDVWAARGAPARWVARNLPEAGSPPNPYGALTPGTTGGLLTYEF